MRGCLLQGHILVWSSQPLTALQTAAAKATERLSAPLHTAVLGASPGNSGSAVFERAPDYLGDPPDVAGCVLSLSLPTAAAAVQEGLPEERSAQEYPLHSLMADSRESAVVPLADSRESAHLDAQGMGSTSAPSDAQPAWHNPQHPFFTPGRPVCFLWDLRRVRKTDKEEPTPCAVPACPEEPFCPNCP